jgi:predicted N-acetyltransferase YhbS
VAREAESGVVAGFYTLCAGSAPLAELPETILRRLPRYPEVPIALIGRLAVSLSFRGRGLGGAMLWHAAETARRSEVAVFALVVDAKDDEASTFYRLHGFSALDAAGKRLMLPL